MDAFFLRERRYTYRKIEFSTGVGRYKPKFGEREQVCLCMTSRVPWFP